MKIFIVYHHGEIYDYNTLLSDEILDIFENEKDAQLLVDKMRTEYGSNEDTRTERGRSYHLKTHMDDVDASWVSYDEYEVH